MNEQEVAEQQAAREHLQALSKSTNTCPEWHVFTLGSNGTAMVSCGLPINHGEEMASETDEDVYVPQHIAMQDFDDGSAVVFRWPL